MSSSKSKEVRSAIYCCFSAIRYSSSLSCAIIQSSSAKSSTRRVSGHSPSSPTDSGVGSAENTSGMDRSVLIRRISVEPVCENKTEKPTFLRGLPSRKLITNLRNCICGRPFAEIQWIVQEASTRVPWLVREPLPIDTSLGLP
jgi:hypothetical protein